MLKNKYGYFDTENREFVITDPRTPRPWFNYMWNGRYAGMISHTGGGFSYFDSPRDNRLTRMRYNCLPWDRPGRYVLVKDADTGKYWSLSWAPTLDADYRFYECRHGMGYTRITTEIDGIRGEITYFVPRDEHAEIWKVRLENKSGRPRNLEIYAFTELLMGNALNDLINQPNDKHFTDIRFHKKTESLIATRRYWVLNKKVSVAQPNIDWDYNLQFGSSLPATGFDASLDAFIGKWRSESNPQAVESGNMGNTEITAGDPVAALQSKINLGAGDCTDFSIFMRIMEKESADPDRLNDWKVPEFSEQKLADLCGKWKEFFTALQVKTPDPELNEMLNTWNQYQSAVTFDMARNAGYYHGGLLFGTGIRDQFQDILGVVMVEPERVKLRLLNALQYQFSDGSTLHNFFKLVGTGERTHHSDTPLWIPFGIMRYLAETGDESILDETVKYYDQGKADVYTHLTGALDYALSELTDRGLPKIMNGDWNDTLDHIGNLGKGETVWGAFFLGYILRDAMPLFRRRHDARAEKRFAAAYDALKDKVNDLCWTGDWYLRAFRDNGKPVGMPSDGQGRIFLNAQSWSVISGMAPENRREAALESSLKKLETPYGMQICWPSYTKVDDTVGLISRCVPGKKENGAVFNHASAWFILAALMQGRTGDAYRIFRKMLPMNSGADIDRYETEPYVFSEYVTGPDHATRGQASHSWLTGSSVWMLYTGVSWMLGIRPELDGLRIDPRIPGDWDGFSAVRRFRGKILNIRVENPRRTGIGVREITVNGKPAQPLIRTEDYSENELNVRVVLG